MASSKPTEIKRTPLMEYIPILARPAEYVNTDGEPFKTTLVLSEEAKQAEDGRYAWMDGQEVTYFSMVRDGMCDLKTLQWDVDWNNPDGPKWRADLPEGPLPHAHDVLFWIITFAHPLISFEGVDFAGDASDSLRNLLNSPESWEPIPGSKQTPSYQISPISSLGDKAPWGYIETKTAPRRLRQRVKEQILATEGQDHPLMALDPHAEVLRLGGGLTKEEIELVRNDQWPQPKTEGKPATDPGMVNFTQEQIVQYMQGKTAQETRAIHTYHYFVAPIPGTFQSTEDIMERVLKHMDLPDGVLRIKYLRRLWVVSTGSNSADFSLRYEGCLRHKGKGTNPKFVRWAVANTWRDVLLNGRDPVLRLETGEEPPEGYTIKATWSAPSAADIFYNGPAWLMLAELEGVALPPIYFADEQEFYDVAVKPSKHLQEKWKGGQGLVYVMNGQWCERNFRGNHPKETNDYHHPAVNSRSLFEWITGPMAHNLGYKESKSFKSFQIFHPISGQNLDEAMEDYNRQLEALKTQNETHINPDLLAMLRGRSES